MTIEEINSLVYTDIIAHLQARMFKRDNIEPIDTIYYSVEDLEAELEIYKEELRVIENERLRKVDLSERFEALEDMRRSFHSVYSEPNPALWLKELLSAPPEEAESKLTQLEAKDVELRPTPEELAKENWIKGLEEELKLESITKDGLLEALVRKVILGDDSLAELIKPKLIRVDQKKPRP